MKKMTALTITLAILLSILWLVPVGCPADRGTNGTEEVNGEMNGTGELEPVEVREYEGESCLR